MSQARTSPSAPPPPPRRQPPVALFLTAAKPPDPLDAPIYWAAREAGFRPLTAPWCNIEATAEGTFVRDGFEALPEGCKRVIGEAERVAPRLIFSRGRMSPPWARLYRRLAKAHPQAWLPHDRELRFLGTKWGTERCLRQGERHGIPPVPRPETFLFRKAEIGRKLARLGRDVPLVWKPADGAQGRGIRLSEPGTFFRVVEEIQADPARDFVVQRFVDDALRLDGKRFDVRLYALVTSFRPLVWELYAGGMARLAARRVEAAAPLDPLSTITNCDFRSRCGAAVENLSLPHLLQRLREEGRGVGDFWLQAEALIENVCRCCARWPRLLARPDLSRLCLITGLDLLLVEGERGIEPLFLELNYASPPIKDYGPAEVDQGLWVTNRRWFTTLLSTEPGAAVGAEHSRPQARSRTGSGEATGRPGARPRHALAAAAGSATPPPRIERRSNASGVEESRSKATAPAERLEASAWSRSGAEFEGHHGGEPTPHEASITLPSGRPERSSVLAAAALQEIRAAGNGEVAVAGVAAILGDPQARTRLFRGVESLLSDGGPLTVRPRDEGLGGFAITLFPEGPGIAAEYTLDPEAGLAGLQHPLAAVLPAVAGHDARVLTAPAPGASFAYLDPDLVGPALRGESDEPREVLLRYLGRVITSRPGADPLGARFVEPGVGRSVLVDFLRVRRRPELADFSALGVGLTRYCEGGFYLPGIHIDGLNSLNRALHRASMAMRLEAEGCRTALPVAVVALRGMRNIMPDGRVVEAGILVRGFRSILRVHQLDPLCPFLNSPRHRPLVADFLRRLSGSGEEDLAEAGPATPGGALLAALFEEPEAVACLCRCPSHIVAERLERERGDARRRELGRGKRLEVTRGYAPILLRLAQEKVAEELGRDPEREAPSGREYAHWFAERLGEQMARLRDLRFLHEYRLGRGPHMLASHSLVETNITLLAEFADLDTGIFVDAADAPTLDTLGISREILGDLQDGYDAFHAVDCRQAARIVQTLAFLACDQEPTLAREAVGHFARAYERRAGRRPYALA